MAQQRRPSPNHPSRWLAVAALAIAVAGGIVVARVLDVDDHGIAGIVEYDGTMTGPGGQSVDAELTVTATGIGRVVDLHTDALPILPTGALYEVWFVATDDSLVAPHRISAGTFHPNTDGLSDVRFAAAVNPALYPIIEITAEPGDGNPTATGAVILRAEIPTQQ
jgi:hypothetical protein